MYKTIIQITDTHIDDEAALKIDGNHRKKFEAILNENIIQQADELIFTGDIGTKSSYQWFFQQLDQYNLKFKIILGNHDNFQEAVKHYNITDFSDKEEMYYSHEDSQYKYIYLDSSSSSISDAQYKWLSDEIVTHKNILLFIHHPLLSVDTEVDRLYPLENREKIVGLLQQSDNKIIVFCGHYHMPDETEVGNIKQYVTPSASFQIKKDAGAVEIDTSSFGYRVIAIYPDRISTKLMMNYGDGFIE